MYNDDRSLVVEQLRKRLQGGASHEGRTAPVRAFRLEWRAVGDELARHDGVLAVQYS